ncbi:ABC transporter substrate-binding protein [Microbacterium sp. No. 7]|uniref:ABC transporter substrate-binding protein n=1 Tax=Microbacterium sp. No. 7 TaxID=1714373 RepID=UPI0006D0A369|nr:ABC transporter substrate-binding protein [Microbacterium sp. No. 7]
MSENRSLTLVLVGALALTGCAASPDGTAPASGDATELSLVLDADPNSFDPARATSGDAFVMNRMLYDTLLRLDDDGIVGGLATQWDAQSATQYAFTIRDDATCADGTAITASIVADSLNHFADPAAPSTFRSAVFGKGDVRITGDDASQTVTIVLSEPYANVERGLTLAQTGIVCPAGLADLDALSAGEAAGAFSGPYIVDEATRGLEYTLVLRDDYEAWPQFAKPLGGSPAKTLRYTLATDISSTANQLLSGDIDLANLSGETVDRFDEQDFLLTRWTRGHIYVIFNQAPGSVFSGPPELRKAVAQAIDQDAYISVFSKGRTAPYLSVVSPDYQCVNEDASLLEKHDPAAAAAALGDVPIRIVQTNALGDSGAGGEYLEQVLTEAGARVELTSTDNSTWATTIFTPETGWDMTIMGDQNSLQLISASLDRVMGPSLASGGRNIGAADNDEGAAALFAGLATIDQDEQCIHFLEAQRTMLERDDVVPLTGLEAATVSRAGVSVRTFGDYLDPSTMRIIR